MDSRVVLPPGTVLDESYRIERVIGSGGFGITYRADDVKLGTRVAIKEYCPEAFGLRDQSLSVRPKSERHQKVFEWGRESFLKEARTLAHFRHRSVVEVTRVFEANATAYMVMVFEAGQSMEQWLTGLGRAPTQEELDRIVWPLLDALEMMHAQNFLHRDIAPDNIIVRPDGSPVLLDFGASRRAVAEVSHALTGIIKHGYSPHEQYTSDGRLQGPWSDLYALGATLYRAVTGKPPEEATLRSGDDRLLPAAKAAAGAYSPSFLRAIDACLRVRRRERPQSVAELRSLLLAPLDAAAQTGEGRSGDARRPGPASPDVKPRHRRRWAAAAVVLALAGGAYGGFEYTRWEAREQGRSATDTLRNSSGGSQRQALVLQKNAPGDAAARVRESDLPRKAEEERSAAGRRAAEEAARQEQDRRRAADAEAAARLIEERRREEARQRRDAERAAEEAQAAEEARQAEARRQAEADDAAKRSAEAARLTLVRSIQTELARVGCDPGPADGEWGPRAREALVKFGRHANVALQTDVPTDAILQQIVARTGRVCPLQCGPEQVASGDRCVQRPARRPATSGGPAPSEARRAQPAREAAPAKRCRYVHRYPASRVYTCD